MLQPRRSKFAKMQKGRNKGLSMRGNQVSFGQYGLQSLTRGKVTAQQIESGRRAMTRYVKRAGKIWIKIFPDKPLTKKPLEVRQGKGKGSVDCYCMPIKPGRILYEIEGVSEEDARAAFKLAADKMPVQTTFVKRFVL